MVSEPKFLVPLHKFPKPSKKCSVVNSNELLLFISFAAPIFPNETNQVGSAASHHAPLSPQHPIDHLFSSTACCNNNGEHQRRTSALISSVLPNSTTKSTPTSHDHLCPALVRYYNCPHTVSIFCKTQALPEHLFRSSTTPPAIAAAIRSSGELDSSLRARL